MLMNEYPGVSVIYRGRKKRIEVEMPMAMFEFNITDEGLVPGARFANGGHDLREVTSVHYNFALRAAQEWLVSAWVTNRNI
jgi:hypothetical protein